MTANNFLLPLAFVISLFSYFANQWLGAMPEVKPASVAATEFSAERAMLVLEEVLVEGTPHPVGSAENKRVKQRILNWLRAHGIEASVQKTWGCSTQRNSCAWVENIVALIPGKQVPKREGTPFVALMAHYDSVPPAPGAGDDGAGLVTVMEVGRMLKEEGPFNNPILLLLTDAEEVGLLGAEAFFAEHPLAPRVGVILNLEGSGTAGPSRLLRTAMHNASLIDAYRRDATYPEGASLSNEIFKRMPNDTDFSVSIRADVPGIDFVFAGERNHYHTANDNLQNLNQQTLQHHGENLLPVARRLANIDLDNLEPSSVVYSSQFGQWIQWPADMSLYLVLISALFLSVVLFRSLKRPIRVILAVVTPILTMLILGLVLFLHFRVLDWFIGTTVAWPAHILPFRLVLFGSATTVGLFVAKVFNQFLTFEENIIGLWMFWWLLALACVFFLPDAANLFILPLVVASVLLVIAQLASPGMGKALQLLTLVLVVPATLGLVLDLEATQGYTLIITTFVSLGLFFVAISPFVRGQFINRYCLLSALVSLSGTVGAVTMPLYSEWRPQHLNFNFIQNRDINQAFWQARSPNKLPEAVTSRMPFDEEISLYPWPGPKTPGLTAANTVNVLEPDIEVQQVKSETGELDCCAFRFQLTSNRHANWISVVVAGSEPLLSIEINGLDYPARKLRWGVLKDQYIASFYGIQDKTVLMTLTFDVPPGDERDVFAPMVMVMEGAAGLPLSGKPLMAARSPLGTPVHQGDQFILLKAIDLGKH